VASLANDVPAVQALGQCLFLPMILIGGVGVPLASLPDWAQRASGFMPGRYAVDLLQRCFSEESGLSGGGFNILALVVIGAACGVVGASLFRWEPGRAPVARSFTLVAVALSSWIAVGVGAAGTGRLAPISEASTRYSAVTEKEIASVTYDDLPGDNELVTRLAPPFRGAPQKPRVDEMAERLRIWAPGLVEDPAEAVRHLLSVAAVADISADLYEAEIGRLVFDLLQERYSQAQLKQILTWIALYPDKGHVVTLMPELGYRRQPREYVVRERTAMYAKKFLGRLVGKIKD
jgi:hypothetical protein